MAVRLRPRNAEELAADADFADCVELQPEVLLVSFYLRFVDFTLSFPILSYTNVFFFIFFHFSELFGIVLLVLVQSF